jgi:hypothetical protein
VKGIEPSSLAWKAIALPLSYTRASRPITHEPNGKKRIRSILRSRIHRTPFAPPSLAASKFSWGVQDSNLRRQSHQIYSLAPLTARETPLYKSRAQPIISRKSKRLALSKQDRGEVFFAANGLADSCRAILAGLPRSSNNDELAEGLEPTTC